jgi:hypothetical protein
MGNSYTALYLVAAGSAIAGAIAPINEPGTSVLHKVVSGGLVRSRTNHLRRVTRYQDCPQLSPERTATRALSRRHVSPV